MKPIWPRYRRTTHSVLTGVGAVGIMAIRLEKKVPDGWPALGTRTRAYRPGHLVPALPTGPNQSLRHAS
jgi:hypothetical protein